MPSRIWVDTSGVALAAALDVPRIAIKVNDAEAGEVLGCMVKEPTEAVHAARSLRRQTQSDVVVTLGACGAILLTDTGSWYVQPPAVPMVSAVGSGDAFLAALVMALAAGCTAPDALQEAGATAAANALSVGGGQVQSSDIRAILQRTTIHAVE